MKDPLIERLVDDLKVVPFWSGRYFWFGAACLYLIACLVIVWGMGYRSDFENAYQAGTLLLKPLLFLAIAVSTAWLAYDISKPDGAINFNHGLLALLAVVVLALLFVYQYHQSSSGWVYQSVASAYRLASGLHCLTSILVGGCLFMAMAWWLWISKTASVNAKWMGALSGLASGAFVASAYAIHCSVDAAPYLLVYYCLPMMSLAAVGYLIGARCLKW